MAKKKTGAVLEPAQFSLHVEADGSIYDNEGRAVWRPVFDNPHDTYVLGRAVCLRFNALRDYDDTQVAREEFKGGSSLSGVTGSRIMSHVGNGNMIG